MAPIISTILKGFSERIVSGLGKEGKILNNAAEKFTYGFGKGFQDSFYRKANAVRLGRQFSDTIGRMFEHVFGSESAKALRLEARGSYYSSRRLGVSGAGLSGFGKALGMYGGNEADIVGSIKSLNAKMTGLNFGNAEFLKQLMMYTDGKFNVYGSGPRGFKTGSEMHDEFARWANREQKNGTLDKGVFEQVADMLSISGPVRDMILDGEYQNVKMRKVLTQEEMENAAALAKAQKQAEFETKRLLTRFGVLGAELRRPLDKLYVYVSENLFSWLSDKLTPEKSEKEVDSNAKENREMIEATLFGLDGGFSGKTAKSNRGEAASILRSQIESGATDEDIAARAVNWVEAEGESDPTSIRTKASMLFSAAKSGRLWQANDKRFSENKDFVDIYEKSLRGTIEENNSIKAQNEENSKWIDGAKKMIDTLERRKSEKEGGTDESVGHELTGHKGASRPDARDRMGFRRVADKMSVRDRKLGRPQTYHYEYDGKPVTVDEMRKLSSIPIDDELSKLREGIDKRKPKDLLVNPLRERQKGFQNNPEDGGFYMDDGNGGRFLLPPDGFKSVPSSVHPPSNGGSVSHIETSLSPVYNIYIQPQESVNNPDALARAVREQIGPMLSDAESNLLAKCSPLLTSSSICGATGRRS